MSGRYDVEKSRAADGAPLVGAPLLALERPGRVALRVQVVAIESRRRAVPIEFDLELLLIALPARRRPRRPRRFPVHRTSGRGSGRKESPRWLWRCGEIVLQRGIEFRNV